MAKVFVLGGNNKGKSVRLMGRYTFIDGVHLEEDDKTAELKAKVLTSVYPVEMMDHTEYVKRMTTSQVDERPAFKKAEVSTTN